MKSNKDGFDALRRYWTRREVLAAGAAALLGLASCGENNVSSPAYHKNSGHALTTSVSTSSPSPTSVPEKPVTLAFTGDVMFGRTVNSHMLATAANDPYPFTYTADFLRSFDLTIGNLECVISRLGVPVPKPYTFRGDARAYSRLLKAGFDLVSVANNHSGDYGKAAFLDEFLTLPTHGITPIGGGQDKQQAHTPIFKTMHGTTIAFLAYDEIDPYSFAATATTPGHSWLYERDLRQDIAKARLSADFVITFVHWGIEYFTSLTGHQRHLAQVAIDSGADLVVGAHPHVIEPYEFYKGKLIVYSLGNFVFDNMYDDVVRRGNILTLSVKKNQLLNWKLVTTRIGDWGEPSLLYQ
ncbi:MAG: CapA family protein [Chloroflexi bacterium]|nr:MAG: CapA family protein [Chloroflexota bacterium]